MKRNYNAVIIGGGASGLACAIRAKLNDKSLKIAIIEKNDRVGKKLLATGNGRCNLTNKAVSPEKYIGSFKPKCEALLKKYDVEAVLGFFARLDFSRALTARAGATLGAIRQARCSTFCALPAKDWELRFSAPKP